jgi:uncharacterized protein
MSDELNLRITGVEPGDEIAGARRLTISTTRGMIPMVLHATAEPQRAVVCLSGAIGGLDGPAWLYARLGAELPRRGVAVARIDYREPVALLGHSFGGAVVINAGTLGRQVSAVAAISSQLAGAHVVADLAPRPLLLVHGTADTILSHQSSEAIFERAAEPKTLNLVAGADHRFSAHGDELFELVAGWLIEKG